MKRMPFLLILFVLAACHPARRLPAENADTMTIMSYNIRHANPPSRKGVIDLDAVAAVIKAQHADVVGLQEVDVHTGRSGKENHQAELLAQKTGMQAFFSKAINYDGGEYGIALLTRHKIIASGAVALPTLAGTGGEPRVLQWIKLQLPGGRELIVANTHMDSQGDHANRMAQMQTILETLQKQALPVVFMGDLNAQPGSPVINLLDQQFTRTCADDCGLTFPQDVPTRTIDFIAFKTGNALETLSHQVVAETYASDHRPIVAKLKWK